MNRYFLLKTAIALLLSLSAFASTAPGVYALSEEPAPSYPAYAEITAGCVLYSDQNLTFAITSLPATYFVTVLSASETAMRVSYRNLNGYISPSCAETVDFTPQTKYASSTLTLVNDGLTVNVRAAPDHNSDNIIARLTHGAALYYYGSVSGTVQNSLIGDTWYCVSLENGDYGYVYSMYADPSPIPDNVIVPEPSPDEENAEPSAVPSGSGEYFFIAALCLPVIVFCYLLFAPRSDKSLQENR